MNALLRASQAVPAVVLAAVVLAACAPAQPVAAPPTSPPAAPPTLAPAPTVAPAARRQPDKMTDAVLLQGWFAQPEQGGLWRAFQDGLYTDRNVNAEIKPAGPGADPIKLVAVGQYKFGVTTADRIALARSEGLPLVALFATFQQSPEAVMVHEESGVTTLDEIGKRGMLVQVAAPSAGQYAYLRKKSGWKEEQLLRYEGQIGEWLNDNNRGIGAWITNEPFTATKAGAHPRTMLIGEQSDFNPYAVMLFTNEEVIQKEPELVQAVVDASLEGWRRFIQSPDETLPLILEKGQYLSEDGMKYTYDTMKARLVLAGDAKTRGIGVMTKARWDTLYQQLKEVDLIKPDLNADQAWTDRFFKDAIKP
jgi:NitT/TauT family transport system substrate-binding protein